MTGLEPSTRAFLEAALASDRPRIEDRERVRSLLAAQLGVPPVSHVDASNAHPVVAAKAQGVAPIHAGAVSALLLGATLLASGAVTVAYWGPQAPKQVESSLAPEASPDHVPLSIQGPADRSEPDASYKSTDSIAPRREAAQQGSRQVLSGPPKANPRPEVGLGLGQEAQLIGEVHSALRLGSASRALELLRQHAEQFPHGALVIERWGARALALCALGERQAARLSYDELRRLAPNSPLLLRVEIACRWGAGSDD